MAIEDQIAQGIRPLDSPLKNLSEVMALKNAAQELQLNAQSQQMNALKLQQAQQEMEGDRVWRETLARQVAARTDGDMLAATQSALTEAAGKLPHDMFNAIQAHIIQQSKERATTAKTEDEAAALEREFWGNFAVGAQASNYDKASIAAWLDSAVRMFPKHAAEARQIAQTIANAQSPEEVKQFIDFTAAGSKAGQDARQAAARELTANTAADRLKKETPGIEADNQIKANKLLEIAKDNREKQQGDPYWIKVATDPNASPDEKKQAMAALNLSAAQKKAGSTRVTFDAGTGEVGAGDPASSSILAQTGLSMPAFYALTGQMSKLPRDPATRAAAMKEAQSFANKRGVDVSTLVSQYQSYNKVLGQNIERLNNTRIMESELEGTIQNLRKVATDKDLMSLNVANVLKIWAGQEVNDDLAQQYAMHLMQLRTELTGYNAAAAGRTGGSITDSDKREAELTIRNGIAKGGLDGLEKAVKSSTEKMGVVMQQSVDRAQKGIWDAFGVGANYKPKASAGGEKKGPQKGATRQYQGHTYTFDGTQWVR